MLLIIAILEGFFVFAYNFEMFKGLFHNDVSFSVSWGVLPVIAGFVIQTNNIELLPLGISAITGGVSYAHIRVSRKYKECKRRGRIDSGTGKLEIVLKGISLSTIATVSALLTLRMVIG